MALVNCPECGRENVSSSAPVCPCCGYPIKQNLDLEKGTNSNVKSQESVVYFDTVLGEEDLSFDNGLTDGAVGKCYEDGNVYEYNVVNDQLYVKRNSGIATYTIAEDYLLNNEWKYNGSVHDGTLIDATCVRSDGKGLIEVKCFASDGSYAGIMNGVSSEGSYARRGDFIAVLAGYSNKPICYLIYNKNLYFASYIKKERVSEVRNLILNFPTEPIIPNTPNTVSPKATANTTNGGCYVATAVYGSYDCPQVWTLRRFRDNTLADTWYGRTFIRVYYATSPTLVKLFGKTNWFKNLLKPTLDRMVEKLNRNGVEDTPYDDRVW